MSSLYITKAQLYNNMSELLFRKEDFELNDWESDDELFTWADERDGEQPCEDIPETLWRSFWRAVNSREYYQTGAELLKRCARIHRKTPSTRNCEDLVDFLAFGPKENSVRFFCHMRIHHMYEYYRSIRDLPGMSSKLSQAMFSMNNNFVNHYLDGLVDAIGFYIQMSETSDLWRSSSSSVTRVCQSIRVHDTGIELIVHLLSKELSSCKNLLHMQYESMASLSEDMASTWDHISQKQFISMLARTEENPSVQLRRWVKSCLETSIKTGHFFYFESTNMKASDLDHLYDCRLPLLSHLGQLVGNMIWIWALRSKQSIYEAVGLIVDVMEEQLNMYGRHPSQFIAEKDLADFYEQVKLQFCLSLPRPLIGKLRKMVAKKILQEEQIIDDQF